MTALSSLNPWLRSSLVGDVIQGICRGKVQSTKLTAQRATSFQRPSAQCFQPRGPRYGRLWDARSAKPGQEIACTSTPDWIDWHPARSELAVLDEAGLLVFVDTRRAGKLLSSRKTDCEVIWP